MGAEKQFDSDGKKHSTVSSSNRKQRSYVSSMEVQLDAGGCFLLNHTFLQIYSDFIDRYNVRIGPEYSGKHFFEITSVNGAPFVPGFDVAYGDCNATVVGSSEGALYKTNLTEHSVMWYWRKALCRQVPLYFEKKVQKGSFLANKYVLLENVYDRFNDSESDCYKGREKELPDGLSDLSKCYFGLNTCLILPLCALHQVILFFRHAVCSIKSTLLRTLSKSADRENYGLPPI